MLGKQGRARLDPPWIGSSRRSGAERPNQPRHVAYLMPMLASESAEDEPGQARLLRLLLPLGKAPPATSSSSEELSSKEPSTNLAMACCFLWAGLAACSSKDRECICFKSCVEDTRTNRLKGLEESAAGDSTQSEEERGMGGLSWQEGSVDAWGPGRGWCDGLAGAWPGSEDTTSLPSTGNCGRNLLEGSCWTSGVVSCSGTGCSSFVFFKPSGGFLAIMVQTNHSPSNKATSASRTIQESWKQENSSTQWGKEYLGAQGVWGLGIGALDLRGQQLCRREEDAPPSNCTWNKRDRLDPGEGAPCDAPNKQKGSPLTLPACGQLLRHILTFSSTTSFQGLKHQYFHNSRVGFYC